MRFVFIVHWKYRWEPLTVVHSYVFFDADAAWRSFVSNLGTSTYKFWLEGVS